jgi:CheY-specific phosphatase CheX
MTSDPRAELFQATARTFESLGFMFPSSVLEEPQKTAPFEAAVSVDFHGVAGGRLVLVLSGGLLPTLLENMLGEALPATPRVAYDALGELANVICGNALTMIHGKEATFLLDPPRPVKEKEIGKGRGDLLASLSVGMENGRADVLLYEEPKA